MGADMISSKEIVEKYKIPYSTLNHYTLVGLLTIAGRKKNMRLYNDEEVKERLKRIADLRSKGYPLSLIQKELNNEKG